MSNNRIAIIPARGGSKRIPRKNIRPFLGRPIIWYPIRAAIDAGCFTEVMVSTDDPEIAAVAKDAGAVVPFLRSSKTADDYATTADVLIEVIGQYGDRGSLFGIGCCIYPVAVRVTGAQLRDGLRIMEASGTVNGVVPVVRFGYPIQRAVRIQGDYLEMLQPEHVHTRSQDLEPTYHDAGQFYWFRTEALLQAETLLGPRVVPMLLSELEVQDIDTEDDWRLAELKYQMACQTTDNDRIHPSSRETTQ